MENKTKFLKSPLIIAAIICFAIAIIVPLSFRNNVNTQVKGISQTASPKATVKPSPKVSATAYYSVKAKVSVSPSARPVTAQTGVNNAGQASTPAPTPQPTSVENTAAQTFQVTLSINGSSAGSVDVPQGGNQCDVLTRAKDQGKIQSLLMKYDNSLGTNGVYQINGQGKENAVWWVYKVNGNSPNQGCSYIKANSGDSVEWEYKGS